MEVAFKNECCNVQRNIPPQLTSVDEDGSENMLQTTQIDRMHQPIALIDKNITMVGNIISKTLINKPLLDDGHNCTRLPGCMGTFCRTLYLGDGGRTTGKTYFHLLSELFHYLCAGNSCWLSLYCLLVLQVCHGLQPFYLLLHVQGFQRWYKTCV